MAGHAFWRYADPAHPEHIRDHPYGVAFRRFYERLDDEIGRLLQLFDSDTSVLVVSDHGAGPMEPDGSSNRLRCNILNVSTKVVDVTIEVLDQGGAIVNAANATFEPGTGGFLVAFDDELSGFGLCRFTVLGKASAVRATATVFDPAQGTISAVAAH